MLYILKQRYRVYRKKSIIFLKILIFNDDFYQLMDKVVIHVNFVVNMISFVVIMRQNVVNIGENGVNKDKIVVIPE